MLVDDLPEIGALRHFYEVKHDLVFFELLAELLLRLLDLSLDVEFGGRQIDDFVPLLKAILL